MAMLCVEYIVLTTLVETSSTFRVDTGATVYEGRKKCDAGGEN